MKTANDVVQGRITHIDENGNVTITAHYDDWYTLTKRQYRKCNIQMIDSRPLSDRQRRACYALIGEIAEYTGDSRERTKDLLKIQFLAEELQGAADSIFSLANAPMSLVCAFQRYLVDFIVGNEIPCSFPLLDYVDDMGGYIYSCLINKKCCVCGKKAELHHVDRVGMGRDRTEIIHEGMEAMPLCREHHTECHTIGQITFNDKYHFDGGIVLDKTLYRIWKLKTGGKK